ncbi:MAG: pentapeptide repeat-containing protein [Geitlerinemataceae cyanobacterium]
MAKPRRHNFAKTKLVGLSFDGQNLAGADFSETYINNCTFNQTNLAGATFLRARIGHGRRTMRRKLISAFVTATATLVVLAFARLNNSAFMTASMLAVLMVAIAQMYKYTPALVWLWAAALPATSYLSLAGIYRTYQNLNLLPIAIAYGIVALMFGSISIVFAGKLFEGIRSTGASFQGANLTHANFAQTRIEKANFLQAKLKNAKWSEAILSKCKFSPGDLPAAARLLRSSDRADLAPPAESSEQDIRIY